jgi:hypothetical protein
MYIFVATDSVSDAFSTIQIWIPKGRIRPDPERLLTWEWTDLKKT